MEGGEITHCTSDAKSSFSSLPSFSPALTYQLGCKLICQQPSFYRPSCKAKNMSRFCVSVAWLILLQTEVADIPGGKTSNRPRVQPSSPLFRLEGKEVSPWKKWEEGHGGCCQPSLDFFWEVSSWTPCTFLNSRKVSLCVLLSIKIFHSFYKTINFISETVYS